MADLLLYLVRHGEADRAGALTDTGREQAALLGERLKGTDFHDLHHSTMQRAVETAEVLSASLPGVSSHPSDLLRECIPEVPDDRLLTESQRAYFAGLPAEARTEGALQAAIAWQRFAVPPESDRRLLLVTHGNLINWLVCHAMKSAPGQWVHMTEYNCGLSVLRVNEAGTGLVTFNDVGHLPARLRGTDAPASRRI